MSELRTAPLLPRATFDAFMEEVSAALDALPPKASAYEGLVDLASIYQAFANRLADLIYQHSLSAGGQKLACAAGCSTCCHVPSDLAANGRRGFWMSYLDGIWLADRYPIIKAALPSINERAIAAASAAREGEGLQVCPCLTDEGHCGIYGDRPAACKVWFSADLGACIRNRDGFYPEGANRLTDLSKEIYAAYCQPFIRRVEEIDAECVFANCDFLETFEQLAMLDEHQLFGTFREKVDAGQAHSWDPFDDDGLSLASG